MLKKTPANLSVLLLLAMAAAPLHPLRAQSPASTQQPAVVASTDFDADDDSDDAFTLDPDSGFIDDSTPDLIANPDGVTGGDPEPPGHHGRHHGRHRGGCEDHNDEDSTNRR